MKFRLKQSLPEERRMPSPGTHLCKVVGIIDKDEEGKPLTSGSGNAQFAVVYEVLAGDDRRQRFRDYYTITENSLWRITQAISASGLDPDEISASKEFDTSVLMDKIHQVVLSEREYKGELRVQVSEVRKPTAEILARASDANEEDDLPF